MFETRYTYAPLRARELLGTSIWEKKAYAKPRKALCVDDRQETKAVFSRPRNRGRE